MAAQSGIAEVSDLSDGGLVFKAAGEGAVAELSLALVESGALVLELIPRQATLEDLFFRLTEDGATPTANALTAKPAGVAA